MHTRSNIRHPCASARIFGKSFFKKRTSFKLYLELFINHKRHEPIAMEISVKMIMQDHHSESLNDICPLFLFAIQRFFTRVFYYQKQPSEVFSGKRCSENMQQIYRRTSMPKCSFSKVALQPHFSMGFRL